MTGIVPLVEADTEELYGAKAVGLGDALRAGLPVPPGVGLSGPLVDSIASGEPASTAALLEAVRELPTPLAVRSSAVGEDSAGASFAGQHITVLNVPSADDVEAAVREVWWSANSDSAITYRKRLGVFARPSVGVVVQSLLQPDTAGVMFTRNPITGADERMIEASWGLGEAVVSGRVIPDSFRVARSGEVLSSRAGLKRFAIRSAADGGTVDVDVAPDLVESLCLSDAQLQALSDLAADCERVYGPERDIEWAFAGRAALPAAVPCADDVGGRRGAGGGEGTGGPGRVAAAGAAPVEPPRGRPRRHRATLHPAHVRAGRDRHQGRGGRGGVLPHRVGHGHRHRGRRVPPHARRRRALRRDRPDRRGRTLGHGDRRRRARVPGHHPVGLPAAGAAQPDHGLDAPADPRRHAAPDR